MIDNQPQSSNVLLGSLCIVGGMFVIGLVDNFIRFVAEEGGLWQFHFMRSLISCPLLFVICLLTRRKLWPKRFWPVAIRSFLMASAIVIYFGAISIMPIAEAGAILFTSPLFLLLFSVLLFKTKIGFWRILSVLAGFTGVLLVLKPDTTNLNIFTIVPLLAGMFYAMGQLITRHQCSNEHTETLLFGFFVGTGTLGLIGLLALAVIPISPELSVKVPFFTTGWVEPSGRFLFWTGVQAIGSLIAVTGLIRGYQIAEPTYVAVYEYSFLIFGGLWAWVLWNEIPDAISVIGILFIAGAGIVITLRTRASSA